MPRYDITRAEQFEFIEGYIEAILWANTYAENESGEVEPVDAFHGSLVLSDDAMRALENDCFDFLTPQVVRLLNGANRRSNHGYSLAQAGHDFALTRNGHGAGFWDRGLGIVGEALTKLAEPYGSRSLLCRRRRYLPDLRVNHDRSSMSLCRGGHPVTGQSRAPVPGQYAATEQAAPSCKRDHFE